MIKYALMCEGEHQFEAWFDSIAGFEQQRKDGVLRCPLCDSNKVDRALMAPSIPKKSKGGELDSRKVMQMMQKMSRHVQDNFDYVGDRFADEARAIYYGEKEDRDIYGETSVDEARALIEEGVPVAPLPGVPDRTKN